MLSVCYRQGNKGLERLRNLLTFTQLVCGRQGSTSETIFVDTMKPFRKVDYIYIPHYIPSMKAYYFPLHYVTFKFQNQII